MKNLTANEFFNHWVRTNRDPDGEFLQVLTIGGACDSYGVWTAEKVRKMSAMTGILGEIKDEVLALKDTVYIRNIDKSSQISQVCDCCTSHGCGKKSIKAEILGDSKVGVDKILVKSDDEEVENEEVKNEEVKNEEVENEEVKNEEVKKYKWVSEKKGCSKCKSLDGTVFEEMPNIEEISHPNCNCEVVEISEEEAQELEKKKKDEIEKRDEVVDYASENVKIEQNGKWYNPITGLEEKHGQYGDCGKYVTNAIQSAYPDYQRQAEAKDSGKSLEEIGFIEIPADQNYKPEPGDVAVFQNYEGGSDAGHVQIYGYESWISDYNQNTEGGKIRSEDNNLGIGFFPNQSYKDKGEYEIYRNPNWFELEL